MLIEISTIEQFIVINNVTQKHHTNKYCHPICLQRKIQLYWWKEGEAWLGQWSWLKGHFRIRKGTLVMVNQATTTMILRNNHRGDHVGLNKNSCSSQKDHHLRNKILLSLYTYTSLNLQVVKKSKKNHDRSSKEGWGNTYFFTYMGQHMEQQPHIEPEKAPQSSIPPKIMPRYLLGFIS